MSAISQKSISGITSITTPASVDNQFTIHTNNTTEAFKLDHAGNIHIHNHVNTTGISSASNFKTGTSNLHSTGLNIFDLDVDGHTNLDNVSIAGVTTASSGLNISGGNLQMGGTNVLNSGRALYNIEQIKLGDSKELVLGAGNDLKIYHSGVHSFISEEGNGALKFKGDDIRFEDAGGTEALRIGSAGQIGIAGANYGTSGQALVSQGSGSSVAWQTITGTTINNNANNRVITGSGTANTLEGEANLTFDGKTLTTNTHSYPETTEYLAVFKAGVANGNRFKNRYIKIRNNYTGSVHGGVPIVWEANADGSNNKAYGAVVTEGNGDIRFLNAAATSEKAIGTDLLSTISEKLRIDSAGQVLPGADDAQNLGSSTKRWANIYAADMHYSNEGGENSVDGTWGSYTIQEGESDLYLLNNRNGKKYKFVLQEVS